MAQPGERWRDIAWLAGWLTGPGRAFSRLANILPIG